MNAGRDLLRAFWAAGVRVSVEPGRFRLDPMGVADRLLRAGLRQHQEDVREILAGLPAPDHCQVCGDATRGPAGNTGHIHCRPCALIAAERLGLRVVTDEGRAA